MQNESVISLRSDESNVAPAHFVVPDTTRDRDALFAELSPLFSGLTRQYGRDQDLRQELPGELYCRFHAFLDSYDPARGVPLRPYLVRQLSHSIYTLARRCWRTTRREVALDDCGSSHDPTQEWDSGLAQGQAAEVLADAISKLPLRQRQVVTWRYYEEKSFEEIAAALGVRETTVRSQLRHGLNALRRSFIAAEARRERGSRIQFR